MSAASLHITVSAPAVPLAKLSLFPLTVFCFLSLSKKKKKKTPCRRTLGTFHSFHIIRVCPSKSRFHFLQAPHRGHSVLIKVAYNTQPKSLNCGIQKEDEAASVGKNESQNQLDYLFSAFYARRCYGMKVAGRQDWEVVKADEGQKDGEQRKSRAGF